MLKRSILRYCSEPSLPSHKLPISALVPEMICNRLFNSLVAFETDSFETDLRRCGDEPSEFTLLLLAAFGMPFFMGNCNPGSVPTWRARSESWLSEIPFAIHANRRMFLT